MSTESPPELPRRTVIVPPTITTFPQPPPVKVDIIPPIPTAASDSVEPPLDCQRSISTYRKGRITRNMNPRTRISGTGSSPGDFIGGVSLKRNIQGCPATKSIPLSPASEVATAGFMLTPANVILAVTPPGITMRQPLAAESFVEMVSGVPLLIVSTWQLLESLSKGAV